MSLIGIVMNTHISVPLPDFETEKRL